MSDGFQGDVFGMLAEMNRKIDAMTNKGGSASERDSLNNT